MKKFNIGFFAVIVLMLSCVLSYAIPSSNYLGPQDVRPGEMKTAIDKKKEDKGLSSNTGLTRLVEQLRTRKVSFADVSIAGTPLDEVPKVAILNEYNKINLLDNLNLLNLAGEVEVKGGKHNIASVQVQTVFVMDEYMIKLEEEELEKEIKNISPEKMLVILITSRDNIKKIGKRLKDLEDAGYQKENIILLDITESKTPFQRLFGNHEGFLDLSEIKINTTKDILNNEALIKGLATAK